MSSSWEGKNHQFYAKGYRANDFLELVHINVCGFMNVQAQRGYEYFITFTDDTLDTVLYT
jgi:hypothetical protein